MERDKNEYEELKTFPRTIYFNKTKYVNIEQIVQSMCVTKKTNEQ